MRRALPGSALVHLAIIGVAVAGFAWPEAEDAPAAESVTVSIVTMSSVSSNATAVVQSDATVAMISSGASATVPPTIEPLEPETLDATTEAIAPIEPETRQPVTEAAVEPLPPETVEPQEAPLQDAAEPTPDPPLPVTPEPVPPVEPTTAVALLGSTMINSLASQPVATPPPETIEPVSSEEVTIAPVPHTLSRPRTSTPTYPKPQPQQTPAPRKPAAPPPPSTAGNGGNSNADAVAAAGSTAQQVGSGNGGDAEVAKYPAEVLRKLRRALRSSNGPGGEVVVRFTVLTGGQVTDVSVGRSSGNSTVDQAGLAAVSRAAPFPAIPVAAGRTSWTFDVPLAFGG